MKKSRRLRLLALALAFIMVGSSVVYTNLDQEGKKSEEQTVLEDNDATEIEEIASNELEETESASNQSVKTKDTVDESAKTEEVVDKPEKTKDTVNAPEESKDVVDEPEETKDAEKEPEKSKDSADEPEENNDAADEPGKNQDTVDEPEENKGEEDKITDATEMIVVENAETAVSPKLLRAATYEAKNAETGTIVKYFPVTMYDYDKTTINAATDALDSNLTVREGLYFSGGSPGEARKESVADFSAFVDGQYYIQNIRAENNNVGSWISIEPDGIDNYKIYGKSKEYATVWNLTHNEDGTYSLSTVVGEKTYYMFIGTNNQGTDDGIVENEQTIELKAFSGDARGVKICQNNMYLCQWGSTTANDYGGYNEPDDAGNGMLFYPVGSENPVIPYEIETKIVSGYEEWNFWDKATGNNANGDLFYTGLVRNELIDNEIVFNVNEGGIFDSNSTVKSIYEYVGLPFVFDTTTGYYLFDSDVNGAYFADANGDGHADPQSGTATQPYNMQFVEDVPQPMPTGLSVGDGSTNIWLPFNSGDSYNTLSSVQVNYHLGMRTDLPFSMTANGRVQSTNDESAPITFSFSGDDDVWVFIDGRLVVDLGGIHNRLDVTIDFAANTVTYSEENSADDTSVTGRFNNPDFATIQKIFTDAQSQGLIDMSREVFATEDEHVMTVFYLERGEGTSNCRIEFNLPMNDSVIVTKDATQSWSEALEQQNSDATGVTPLTNAEQAIVDNIQFGFTLYKKNEEGQFSPITNTKYQLIGRAIEGVAFGSTDSNGHFYLKNGQSAKFITDIPETGATYCVVEDAVPDGFVTPDFKYDGEAANGFGYYEVIYDEAGHRTDLATEIKKSNAWEIPEHIIDTKAEENKSNIVTVYGSIEASDNVEFQCINFVDSELPNPTATAPEDIIVLDYGLPVQIDPLANDIFRGDNIEIVYIGGPNVELEEEKDGNLLTSVEIVEDGISVVKSNGDLPDKSDTINNHKCHSGKIKFENVDYNDSNGRTIIRDTLTYTMNKPLTDVEVISYVVKVTGKTENAATEFEKYNYDYEVGKIYIVPATTMYYEENFTGLVTFTNSANAKWENDIAVTDSGAVSDYQEPGVVGTVADSTYGSDVAYLNDSGDSNGTCRVGSTANGAIRFSYTFTGTGTSIFARTAADTGYMQIKLYKGTTSTGDGYISVTYRDTYYKDKNNSVVDDTGTLYNIPVYTKEDLEYGTYTVVATVAKKGTPTAGNPQGAGDKFYLDGIRIMKPLNEANRTVINAETEETITDKALGAYATDGESQMDVVTLRYKMITDAEKGLIPWNFVVMTDIDGEIVTAEDYISIGPKEEVYLNEGQSINFGVKYWHPDGYKLYLGMKAPMGSASVKSGANTKALFNATDCYFDITSDYTSVLTKYEQAMDAAKRLLYTDETGSTVYEDYVVVDGTKKAVYKYVDGTVVLDGVELTPMDDITKPYHVAVYTIQSLDGIVSLTNIKAVGNYTFVLTEDINIDIDIDTDNDVDNDADNDESSEVYVVKQSVNTVSSNKVCVENSEIVDVENDPVIEELDNEESPEETGGENL